MSLLGKNLIAIEGDKYYHGMVQAIFGWLVVEIAIIYLSYHAHICLPSVVYNCGVHECLLGKNLIAIEGDKYYYGAVQAIFIWDG